MQGLSQGSTLHTPVRSPAATIPGLLTLGVVFWIVGVLLIRAAAPLGAFRADFSVPLFLGSVPVAWLVVRFVWRITGRDTGPGAAGRLIRDVGMVCMPALLLDGVVMTWAPGLYSNDAPTRLAASAYLLWFVGVSLALPAAWSARPPAVGF